MLAVQAALGDPFGHAGRQGVVAALARGEPPTDLAAAQVDGRHLDNRQLAGRPPRLFEKFGQRPEVGRWFAAVNVQAFAGDYFVDHENAFTAPGDIVLGFSAGMQLTDQAILFVSGENITDTNYAAGVTQVSDQTVLNGRIFTPAARASVYGGLKYRF